MAGVSGKLFADEIQHLEKTCNSIQIRYNSHGGSVVDGWAIYHSILNCKVPTESYIDGMAASTAGWCALAAKKVFISDVGALMVHGASGADPEMVDLANGSIAKMLSNRTGMTIEETTDLLTKETWYKAFKKSDRDFLKNKKIVDGVFYTGRTVNVSDMISTVNMYEVYTKIINYNMEKINAVLKLKNDASEDSAVSAIEALTSEKDAIQNELNALKEANKKREEAERAALKTKAEALVNKAVADKKIKEDEKASYLTNASQSQEGFEFVSSVFSKIGTGTQAVKIFDAKNVKLPNGSAEDRSTWNCRDWEIKDPKGLQEMVNNHPEQYEQLYNTFYKK